MINKRRIYEIVQVASVNDRASRVFDQTILILIVLNVIAVILETVNSINVVMGPFFKAFEMFSVAVFTVEYILRLWTCTYVTKYNSAVTGRIQYMFTPIGYGDVYPITALGKMLGALIALLGVGMVALPTGIIGSGFVEEIQKDKQGRDTCPHCGESLRQ